MKNYSVDRKVWIPLKRTCLLAASATLFFIAGCGSKGVEEFGLKQEKINDSTLDRALHVANLFEGEEKPYKKKDIVIDEVCKASLKESSDFSGKYLVHWKTKDGKKDGKYIMDDEYKLDQASGNGYEAYKVYNDECVSPE